MNEQVLTSMLVIFHKNIENISAVWFYINLYCITSPWKFFSKGATCFRTFYVKNLHMYTIQLEPAYIDIVDVTMSG